MCGIFGVFGSYDRQLVKNMTNAMIHRGPDDSGFFFDKNIALGQRRLSIIDISGGKQPIFNEDGSIVIVFNGEIYNYQELKIHLETLGHKFSTNSDTETIVHAYEEYGFDCVNKLDGVFAFAIWDENKKQLFIARDRLGIKPLYYASVGDKFIFCSEIKSLILDPDFDKSINIQALHEFVNLQYTIYPNTIFKSVKKLGAGHYLIINKRGVQEHKFWDLNYLPQSKSSSFYQKNIRKLLDDAVKKRLIAEVPLGAFLSGGIDSSIVVGLMTKHSNNPVKTFSIGFQDKEFDETAYARLVSQKFNTDHKEFVVDYDMLDYLPKITRVLDEPLADAASIPTFILAEHARKYVTVVLTGEGGDENFAGYPYYRWFKFANSASNITPNLFYKKPFNKLVSKAISSVSDEKYKTLFSDTKSKESLFYRKIFGFEDNDSFFNEDIKKQINRKLLSEKLIKPYFQNKDFINSMQRWDTKIWLPDDLLMKVDKTTLGNSLEARVPFLDYKFMQFIATIPSKQRFSYFKDKTLLKQSFKDILPKEIMKRKKGGFNVPIEQWFSKQYKNEVVGIFEENKHLISKFFNHEKLLRNVNSGTNPILTWRITNFIYWYNNYFE